MKVGVQGGEKEEGLRRFPPSHSLRVGLFVHSTSGEQLSLQENKLRDRTKVE